MGKPTQPEPPNPFTTAQAQTASNRETAITQSILNNVNENTPMGSVSHSVLGEAGGVPIWQRDITLSPEQQGLYNQQVQLGSNLNNMALQQTDQLTGLLGSPVSTGNLPTASWQTPMLGNAMHTLNTTRTQQLDPAMQGIGEAQRAVNLQRDVGPNDFSQDRLRVEQALYDRLNPQLDRTRDMLETRLTNQGFVRGTTAFNNAMDEATRQENDMRLAITARGGEEQSRQFQNALAQGNFRNTADLSQFDTALQGYNARLQGIGAGMQNLQGYTNLMGYGDQQRQAALQEQLSMRNQPINETTALMSGGQVSLPNFAQYRPAQMDSTPLGQYIYNSAGLANQNYQNQISQNNAMMSGAFGAIGNAFRFSDRGLKQDIKDTGIRLLNGLKVYTYRIFGRQETGFIAQEVRPDATRSINGFLAVNYGAASR